MTSLSQTQCTAGSRARPAAPGAPLASSTRRAAATQVRQQRRRYARAILACLARSCSGRPVPEIQCVLQQARVACGVRLSFGTWRDLVANINAPRPVML